MSRPHERRRGSTAPIADEEALELIPPSPALLEHLDRKFPDTLEVIKDANSIEEIAVYAGHRAGAREVIDYLFNLAEKEL
jgi:hypothetical protein